MNCHLHDVLLQISNRLNDFPYFSSHARFVNGTLSTVKFTFYFQWACLLFMIAKHTMQCLYFHMFGNVWVVLFDKHLKVSIRSYASD